MYSELLSSIAYGIFTATSLQFIPVILRRWGATSDQLALYIAQSYFGMVITAYSLVLMQGRRPKDFTAICWLLARLSIFGFALVHDVTWALVITGVFWFLESFPSPAYAQILQATYPDRIRGQASSIVRLGMAGTLLLCAPLAGWALDHWGYRPLFVFAGLMGSLATWLFYRIEVPDSLRSERKPRALTGIWQIIRRDRRYTIHLLAVAIYGLGALLGNPLYPLVQVDRLNLSYTDLGLLSMIQSLCWLLGLALWGRLIDQRGASAVLRLNILVAIIVPLAYLSASTGWMLLPAFMAQGIISAGIDLAFLTTCIQLAEGQKVLEYAAIQATVIGVRGMVGAFLGAGLLRLGVSDTLIFALGAVLILVSWFIHRLVRV